MPSGDEDEDDGSNGEGIALPLDPQTTVSVLEEDVGIGFQG